MNDRHAYIILNLINGIGYAKVKLLIESFGSAAAIFSQSTEELCRINGITGKLAAAIVNWREQVDLDGELEFAAKAGVTVITLADDNYPDILRNIYDPPLCLYVRGELPRFDERAIAVVGSRRVSNYGRKMARHLSESLAYAKWLIVSGLAYGVDAIAHQACLDAGGVTVAVLGSGLARIHPQDHIPLARDIVRQGGAIISEYPLNFPASRQSFPRRNRIISGLCTATLVIEAGIKSGALITANTALEQGRTVFAVPGQADNPQAAGCNRLIRDGAILTETIEDIVHEFEFLPGLKDVGSVASSATVSTVNMAGLSPLEADIIKNLQAGERSLDELAELTAVDGGTLMGVLMKLEIEQLIIQLPGKIYSLP